MGVISSFVIPGQNVTLLIREQLESVKHLSSKKKEEGQQNVRLGFGLKYQTGAEEEFDVRQSLSVLDREREEQIPSHA